MAEEPWLQPAADLALLADEVHVWRAELEQPAAVCEELARSLVADEQQQAARFTFDHGRRRFVVARGVLRTILGRYLGVEPGRVSFDYGPRGKPRLGGTFARSGVSFNLAHSQELALYAFAVDRAVGVDLEYARPLADADEIAGRFFSERELAAYRRLPPDQRQEAFYLGWTRKEAYLKALGEGLSRALGEFDVSLAPGEPARLLQVSGDPAEASRWTLVSLAPAAGYVAALAVEGQGWRLRRYHFASVAFS